MSATRVLVAGIGNVFLGDDGFGVEVVRRLDPSALPAGVTVVDYGIRGVQLACDLLDSRPDLLVLVDAVPLDDEPPGTLALLEVDTCARAGPPAVEAHSMSLRVVLATVRGLGGEPPRVVVVGCQPADLPPRTGLSEPVRAAVEEAVRLVIRVVTDQVQGGGQPVAG